MNARPVLFAAFGLAIATLVAGCTSLAGVTSGHVGCAPTEIRISEQKTTFGGTTWTAECHGRRHYCSTYGEGQVACTPEAARASAGHDPDPLAPSGCDSDTQCTAGRICEDGQCVEPPPSPTPETPDPPTDVAPDETPS